MLLTSIAYRYITFRIYSVSIHFRVYSVSIREGMVHVITNMPGSVLVSYHILKPIIPANVLS